MFKIHSRPSSPSPPPTSHSDANTASAAATQTSSTTNFSDVKAHHGLDGKDKREALRPGAIPHTSTSQAQNHFAALDLGKGKSTISMPAGGAARQNRPAQTPKELAAARAERKTAKAAKKEAAKEAKSLKPLSAHKLHQEQVDAIKNEDAPIDLAERTLQKLPSQMPMTIADGKIHKYVFNTTHIDGAPKAEGFEALGHPVRPGGSEYPLTREMYEHGERLKSQIINGASRQPAIILDDPPSQIAKMGVSFNVHSELQGIGAKSQKKSELLTAWIDKREGAESSRGILELSTLIPKGKKR